MTATAPTDANVRRRRRVDLTHASTDSQPVHVIGYARVSSDDQGRSGLGLEAQEAAIRSHASHMGWTLVDVVREVASGKGMRERDRPHLRDVLTRLRDADDPAEGVLVAKLDRLSRSVVDGARMFERARAEGWHIVAIDLQLDTSTPMGEMMANLMLTIGQWERRMIGERTRDALSVRRSKGVKLGRPLTADEVARREAGAAVIAQLRAGGLSIRAIADRLNADGVPTISGAGRWNRDIVHKIVRELAGTTAE